MEFNFNLNNYFKEEITKIGSRLIPEGFVGDRREVQDCLSKINYILNVLGEKSAKAQGLQKVITSGEKLRNSDHVVYVLVDLNGGSKGYGTVLGMLKMGVKHLYVFDAGGTSHEVTTKCVLDFYVHESKQRMGLGKKLFQYMLKEERVDPVHLAIDKPSSKFLSFLIKHYGLQTVIPQMNNFVVFDGFFNNRTFGESNEKEKLFAAGVSTYGNRLLSGSTGYKSTSPTSPHHYQSSPAINLNNTPYYGRPAPHKPVSTMGTILQQKPPPSQQPQQNGSTREEPAVDNLSSEVPTDAEKPVEESAPEENDKVEEDLPPATPPQLVEEEPGPVEVTEEKPEIKPPTPEPQTPVIPVENNNNNNSNCNNTITNHSKRLNSQGHLDLKFYHSSLW